MYASHQKAHRMRIRRAFWCLSVLQLAALHALGGLAARAAHREQISA